MDLDTFRHSMSTQNSNLHRNNSKSSYTLQLNNLPYNIKPKAQKTEISLKPEHPEILTNTFAPGYSNE